jgi:hypothetical protein
VQLKGEQSNILTFTGLGGEETRGFCEVASAVIF